MLVAAWRRWGGEGSHASAKTKRGWGHGHSETAKRVKHYVKAIEKKTLPNGENRA